MQLKNKFNVCVWPPFALLLLSMFTITSAWKRKGFVVYGNGLGCSTVELLNCKCITTTIRMSMYFSGFFSINLFWEVFYLLKVLNLKLKLVEEKLYDLVNITF